MKLYLKSIWWNKITLLSFILLIATIIIGILNQSSSNVTTTILIIVFDLSIFGLAVTGLGFHTMISYKRLYEILKSHPDTHIKPHMYCGKVAYRAVLRSLN
jgi:uncharacterized membrane protein